jgi:predicted DNA binding CopG/RHH family protein
MNKKYKLSAEEQAIFDELEQGEWEIAPNQKSELSKLQSSAKNHGNKVHRVNIRLTDWDYEKARTRALEQGIPFTTFIGGIVHQFLSGQFRQ